MKKALSLLLALVLCLSLCACGNDSITEPSDTNPPTESGSRTEDAIVGAWNIGEGYYDVFLFYKDGTVKRGDEEYEWWYDKETEKYCFFALGISFTVVIEEDENGRFFNAGGERFSYIENYDPDFVPHTHVFGAWETVSEATCTQTGLMRRVCECGETETQEIAMAKHEYSDNACIHCGCERICSEGLFYERNDDGISFTVAGIGTCTDTDIVIPSVYKDCPVTAIANKAFYNLDTLTSIDFPTSITKIGTSAFGSCDGLTKIIIPNNVTVIGSSAFSSCKNLSELVIGNGVIGIGSEAFNLCDNLAKITIGNSLSKVNYMAFGFNWSSPSVYISDLTAWCNIYWYDSSSHPMCFGGDLYVNDVLVTELKIPDDVTQIHKYAFWRCNSLTSVIIPDGVTSIGDDAFGNCANLATVKIPNSVTEIGSSAFADCEGLSDIYYAGTYEQWKSIDKNSTWADSTVNYTLHCTDGDFARYE